MSTRSVRIGDVVALKRRPAVVDPTSDCVFLGMSAGGKGFFRKAPIPGSEIRPGGAFELHTGDFVYSRLFAWKGTFEIAGPTEHGRLVSGEFPTFTVDQKRLDARWLRYWLLSEEGLDEVRDRSTGSTPGSRNRLREDRFLDMTLPLPDLMSQRHAADKLDKLASCAEELQMNRERSISVASALPFSLRSHLEQEVDLTPTFLGDVLQLERDPVEIDPRATYISIGVRSFGKGIFHYPPRLGSEIGKLRFQSVKSGLLVVSNIKAWEGAVSLTGDADSSTVASNRFLFFRPVAGDEATDYFWTLLLGREGVAALGQASPGSADRNRTLAIDRFQRIQLNIPSHSDQTAIGREIRAARALVTEYSSATRSAHGLEGAILPSAMNQFFHRSAD